MWNRFKRMIRSIVGLFISFGEDPELILEQNIRDMQDQVPRMNENIAMVKANVTLLEKEERKYKMKLNGLTSKVKAAIQAGRDDIAVTYATTLEQTKSALIHNQGELSVARQAYDKAQNVKKAFMRTIDKKTREARGALRDKKRAEWQKKVADAMESFEVAGIDQTHDEMIRKIEEESAVNEARMEMAMDNIDHQGLKIEEEAEKIQANELLKQFKMEMGMASVPESTGATESPQKTMGPRERN
ncbi:MAG: hypothetical protein B6244_01885 [Candidatus Cloacimonetes bacterium 4572_55]|nr:MAG: hypothetical protein B6244_01885 [Candidatus Cloacimonetes bacterium 4572_55]